MWDAAFSFLHEDDPSEKYCDETQERIDLAMEKHRELEKHVVDQMRWVKGGIKKMIEHWVELEHYHQIGHRYDMKWRNQKNEKEKAETRARREFTASHPEVLKRLKSKDKKRRRKTPEAITGKEAHQDGA